MEYVKYYWDYIDMQTPILIFAELDEERYSTRQIEIFPDRHIEYLGIHEAYVSEEPYDSNEEINNMGEFQIFNISQLEFETLWNPRLDFYTGHLKPTPSDFENDLKYAQK